MKENTTNQNHGAWFYFAPEEPTRSALLRIIREQSELIEAMKKHLAEGT